MFFCFFKKVPTFAKAPVLYAFGFIAGGNLIQNFPMCQYNLLCFNQRMSVTVNRRRLCSTTIVFQNRKILSFLQIFNRRTFYIVTTVIKVFCIMTEFIKYAQQAFIFFTGKTDQFSAAT